MHTYTHAPHPRQTVLYSSATLEEADGQRSVRDDTVGGLIKAGGLLVLAKLASTVGHADSRVRSNPNPNPNPKLCAVDDHPNPRLETKRP